MARKRGLIGWTDVFLLLIIVLNILDFSEFISTELDYLKKLISWTLLGYLLFRASPSKVFFGKRSDDADTLIITAYFLLVVKNLISYASVAFSTASPYMRPFYGHLVKYSAPYELWTFVAGIVLLIGIGVYVAVGTEFKKRSVMGVLHEEGPPKKYVERFFMTMLVLFGFFLFVFNMMMEWLAIAVDATLLLVALLFWSVFLIRHKVSVHRYLDRVGNIGSDFYRWFIDHFRYKETFMLGIVGILVLHLLTDIGNFLIPYLIGVQDQLYFGLLGAGHGHVWNVLFNEWSLFPSLVGKASLLLVFMANIIAYLLLFVSPGVIWYHLYHRRHPRLPRGLLIAFLSSLPVVLLSPLFVIGRPVTNNLIGVDVQTRSLMASSVSLSVVAGVVLLILAVLLVGYHHQRFVAALQRFWVGASLVFFGSYIWYYFIDVASFYQGAVFLFMNSQRWFLAVVFFVFMALIILFYVGGFLLLLYELGHRPVHEKKAF